MKTWLVLLALGAVFLAAGGTMVAIGWHHTIGLAGVGLGLVLQLGGLLVATMRKEIKGASPKVASPSKQTSGLRKVIIAVIVVVLVAVTAFYGASYLASAQSTNSSSSLSTSSRSSQTTLSSSGGSSHTTSSSTTASTTSPSQISLVTVKLFAGRPTNATAQGAAAIYFVVHNAGPATSISSVFVFSPIAPQSTAYQCASSTVCSPISSPVVSAASDSNFTTSSTGFYIGANLVENQTYSYQITFADGEALSGFATAGPNQ